MYKYFEIQGDRSLSGEIKISGAKNASLPILIASILSNGEVNLSNIPNIEDINIIISILERLGVKVESENDQLHISNENLEYKELVYGDVTKLRASYYFIGAMLGKYSKVKILLPGGCFLGPRPIDLHIKGLELLGCSIKKESIGNEEILEIDAPNSLKGTTIFLDFPSVGATINLILAAVNAEGKTVLENAAKEPEVVDVVTFLKKMGANIEIGADSIIINGGYELSSVEYEIIPDRIEAGTYIMIGALLGENYKVSKINIEHLESLIAKLKEAGVELEVGAESITINKGNRYLKPLSITTGVYPSFPTDLQQVIVTLLTQVKGVSKIEDRIYPNRFRNCEYLNKMGSNIQIKSNELVGQAKIIGGTPLKGKEVIATDLRAGASLIFGGLIASGTTRIYDINHILRGYDNLLEKLKSLGANIELVEVENK